MPEKPVTNVEQMARRLRSVSPEEMGSRLRSTPLVIDPPCPDTLSDDWIVGWQACRDVLANETQAAYERGLRAHPARPVVRLEVALAATLAFILGFAFAIAFFA